MAAVPPAGNVTLQWVYSELCCDVIRGKIIETDFYAGSRLDMTAGLPTTYFLQASFFFIQRFLRHIMGKNYGEGG